MSLYIKLYYREIVYKLSKAQIIILRKKYFLSFIYVPIFLKMAELILKFHLHYFIIFSKSLCL